MNHLRFLAGLGTLVLVLAAHLGAAPASVSYAARSTCVGLVDAVDVDLGAPGVDVAVQLPEAFPGGHEPFTRLVGRARPVAAIAGTYFDKRTLRPVGDIVVDGELRHQGLMGTALALTPDNQPVMRRVEWGRGQDWSAYRTVLAAGPTLVCNGRIDVDPSGERFRDPHVLGVAVRAGAGLTGDGRLILCTSRGGASLEQWARAMRELGCRDAMCLDGGGSLALYYRGKYLCNPGRRLTNILVVREARSRSGPLLARDPEELVQEAAQAEQQGDRPAAGALLFRAAKGFREHGEAARAEEVLGRSLEVWPQPGTWQALAGLLSSRGRAREAGQAQARSRLEALGLADPGGVGEPGQVARTPDGSVRAGALVLAVPPGWQAVPGTVNRFADARSCLLFTASTAPRQGRTLREFEQEESAGTARVLLASASCRVAGLEAMRADYEQLLDGELVRSRTLYVQDGDTLVLLSLSGLGEGARDLGRLASDWVVAATR